MLNNRFAGNIYERLKKLSDAGIDINCQIVLCPGLNNGVELVRTAEDLFKLYPSVKNVAVVPVGSTKFREGLFKITLYDKETSREEISNLKRLQEKFIDKIDYPFIRLSDEFYVIAELDVPETKFYGDFEQLEDGIGMIRLFRNNVNETLSKLDKNSKGSFSMATGVSGYKELYEACNQIKSLNNLININVFKIFNKFFGETITVAGLITGKDLIEQLKDKDLGEFLILPRNMLRAGEDVFLDDIRIDTLETELNVKVIIADYAGEDLVEIINRNSTQIKEEI
jgi:putative radical SAM enzyme (TIGR03279 family)